MEVMLCVKYFRSGLREKDACYAGEEESCHEDECLDLRSLTPNLWR